MTFSGTTLHARLRDTPSAKAIADALPLEATVSTWGREVFFPARVDVEREDDAREVVEPGEIAFWSEGRYIAIGFGRTPASTGDEIRLAAPVNIFADAEEDVTRLADVKSGSRVSVELIED
jgi:hypothetical protein